MKIWRRAKTDRSGSDLRTRKIDPLRSFPISLERAVNPRKLP
jgi:hypothetical protein